MKRWIVCMGMFLTLFFVFGIKAFAVDSSMSFLEELELDKIEENVDQTLEGVDLSFKDIVNGLLKGENPLSFKKIGDMLYQEFLLEINESRKAVISIIMVSIIGIFFTNFTNTFDSHQIADLSFYVIYLLVLVLLVNSFSVVLLVASETVEKLLEFMQVLIPAYCLTVALASGSTTAIVFYEFTILLIVVVQWLLKNLILPLIQVYVILCLVNSLSKEDVLSRISELLKKIINLLLKSLLGIVVGFNVVQGLIAPAADSLKKTVLNRSISIIPGVGNTVNAVTDVILGSGILIKNSVGVAALIIICFICVVPMIKLGIFSFLYKFAAGIIQPLSDKRLQDSIGSVGEGAELLFRVVFTAMILFLITITIITASTNFHS